MNQQLDKWPSTHSADSWRAYQFDWYIPSHWDISMKEIVLPPCPHPLHLHVSCLHHCTFCAPPSSLPRSLITFVFIAGVIHSFPKKRLHNSLLCFLGSTIHSFLICSLFWTKEWVQNLEKNNLSTLFSSFLLKRKDICPEWMSEVFMKQNMSR